MSTETIDNIIDPKEIKAKWEQLLQEKPGTRIKDAADLLQLSEAELLATTISENCIRLEGDWAELLQRLKSLGKVMSLTRNDHCVLENKGTFQKINVMGEGERQMATVIGPIETRVFFKAWHVAFAVKQPKKDRWLESIQIFDKQGVAITKIYLQDKSNREAYQQLIQDFTSSDQSFAQQVFPAEPTQYKEDIDSDAFLNEWAELKDTHDFFGMLRKYEVHRQKVIHLAEGKFSFPIAISATQDVLEQSASMKLPIMIFAGNSGNIQIHQGKVRTIKLLGPNERMTDSWLNIMDPEFNMHLRLNEINEAWIVHKPTEDGTVSSIELFDKKGELTAQFFGLRKPGISQKAEWAELLETIPVLQ